MVGDLDEATNSYGKFFETGCFPSTPKVPVQSIEDKVSEHLSNSGLGEPMRKGLTVHATLAAITENQGAFVLGEMEKAWDGVSKKVLEIFSLSGSNEPAEVTPLASHLWENTEVSLERIKVLLLENATLKTQLGNMQR